MALFYKTDRPSVNTKKLFIPKNGHFLNGCDKIDLLSGGLCLEKFYLDRFLGGHVGLELTSMLPELKGLLITGTPPIEVSADGFSKGFKIVDPKILECRVVFRVHDHGVENEAEPADWGYELVQLDVDRS